MEVKMMKCAAMIVLLAAGVAQANVTENFQIGGLLAERQAGWSELAGGSYSFASATDAQLVFTISAAANNGDTLSLGTTHLSVDSSARQTDPNTTRINLDESLTVTVSYDDPNNVLASLKLNEIGAYWGNNATETTVFTDASANAYSVVGFQHATADNLIDYSTTGLDPLTKANTGSWSLTVSADDTLGTTTTGMGGFELEYVVIPEPNTLGLAMILGLSLMGARRFSRS
jgi:hypothetical protein